jgi:integrase/recombinase XerD
MVSSRSNRGASFAVDVFGDASGEIVAAMRRYLDHLAVERGFAAHSLSAYRRDLRRYLGFLTTGGTTSLGEVGEALIANFLFSLRAGGDGHPPLAASSAARTLVAVRGLHKFAHREGDVVADSARAVRPPAIPRRLPKALSLEQVERIIAAAAIKGQEERPAGLRARALLEFLYGTGARISEAVGLDVDDLDLTQRSVRLSGKGGKQRVLPVGSYANDALTEWLVRGRPALSPTSPAVFLNARGGRLSRQTAWTTLGAAARRAGIDTAVSPHVLRHSYATHLLEGGADIRVVQELLGHASVTTTQVYTLVTVDMLREVYASSHPRAHD